MSRLAVILFSLGGPDSLDAVRPFLRNLFADPVILPAPAPVRFLLSRYIAGRRTASARAAYEELGGASPLLE
ncbi:MAG: ferrochelatase, partial [Alphaproteobacteria bacterium]|nr:ferrochelatase [Alphaproteobacteria bacterium]